MACSGTALPFTGTTVVLLCPCIHTCLSQLIFFNQLKDMLYVCYNIMTEVTPPAIFNFLRKYCQHGSRMKLLGGSEIGATVWVVQICAT